MAITPRIPILVPSIKYTVEKHVDYGKIIFIVIERTIDSNIRVFSGSTTDCYSYIKLKEGGYFNI